MNIRIDPKLKFKPKCCKCDIILSNTQVYNTSTIDSQWCDECYKKDFNLSNCCDALIKIDGRCFNCNENCE